MKISFKFLWEIRRLWRNNQNKHDTSRELCDAKKNSKNKKQKYQLTSAVNNQKMLDWLEKYKEEKEKKEDRRLEIMQKMHDYKMSLFQKLIDKF